MGQWLIVALVTIAGVAAFLAVIANFRIDWLERELEELRKKWAL